MCGPVAEKFYSFPATFCAGATIYFRYTEHHDSDGCYTAVEYYYEYHTCPSSSTGGAGSGSSFGTCGGGGGGYGGNPNSDCIGVMYRRTVPYTRKKSLS